MSLFRFKDRSGDRMKIFINFGQHAREMIASETGLNFLRFLNGDYSKDKLLEAKPNNTARDFILKNIDLHIVPIVNINGHKKVEEGYSCWRSAYSKDPKKNKIDPNRNWGATHAKTP
jgi:murein tripeptide amidase MpaA